MRHCDLACLAAVYSLSPFLRGEGWDEGLSPQNRARGVRRDSPSPAAKIAATSPRTRGEAEELDSALERVGEVGLFPGEAAVLFRRAAEMAVRGGALVDR